MNEYPINPSNSKSVVKASSKALISAIPLVGGSLSSAWSDYENVKTSQRVEEYFSDINTLFQNLETHVEDLTLKVEEMEDAAELMERSIEMATREVNAHKRAIYPKVYTNLVITSSETTPESRMDALYNLEHLNMSDIQLLQRFAISSQRGDVLTNSVSPGFSEIGVISQEDRTWMVTHSDLLQSISKLIARGLIVDTHINAFFQTSGDSSSEYNRFRQKAWRITMAGINVCKSIEIS